MNATLPPPVAPAQWLDPESVSNDDDGSNSSPTAVEGSFVRDGAVTRYRLDGPAADDHDAPLVVFANEILVDLRAWDAAVAVWARRRPGHRFLRYDYCERLDTTAPRPPDATLAELAGDLAALLRHLNVSRIAVLVGLGLGASVAIALLRDTSGVIKVDAFVGASFPLPTEDAGVHARLTAKWEARVALAARHGMAITGHKAAARWLSPSARGSREWEEVSRTVAAGDAAHMAALSHAVLESWGVVGDTKDSAVDGESPPHSTHDARATLAALQIPCLFLCGAGDDEFPELMEAYPSLLPLRNQGRFVAIRQANRLACVERAGEFARLCDEFTQRVSLNE